MKALINKILNKTGYSLTKTDANIQNKYPDIIEKEFWNIFELCKPYSMTSLERMYSLYQSVIYIVENDIKGDFAECGVWRGGSSMLIAKVLKNRNITDRKIYLFDTFEGMSTPSEKDIDVFGKNAKNLMSKSQKEDSVWCIADLKDVQHNMNLTDFDVTNIKYIKGKVEETINNDLDIGKIALLRLDTDWYESTKHELIYLFPILEKNGIIIIDDYGHWKGCRKAVDEYFEEQKIQIFLNRIDYTGRIAIKNL